MLHIVLKITSQDPRPLRNVKKSKHFWTTNTDNLIRKVIFYKNTDVQIHHSNFNNMKIVLHNVLTGLQTSTASHASVQMTM